MAEPAPASVLLAGWFSFPDGAPTAGDEMCLAVVEGWLREAGIGYEVARAVPSDGWDDLAAAGFTTKVWVCGPVTERLPAQMATLELLDGPWLLVNATLVEEPAAYRARGWIVELARDGVPAPRPDLALSFPGPRSGGAALLLRGHQEDHGADRCRCDVVEPAIRAALAEVGMASFELSTIVAGDAARYIEMLERAISTADLVVTTRLHGVIHAVRTGRPYVAIDQISRGAKVTAQLAALGLDPPLSADGLTAGQVVDALHRARPADEPAVRRRAARSAREARDILLAAVSEPASRNGAVRRLRSLIGRSRKTG